MTLEELDAARQQFGVSAERPEPGDAATEAAADPIGHRIAEHGAEDRPHHHRQIGQGAAFHQRAGGDQERRPGKQQAQKSKRLTEPGDEHQRDRPALMLLDQLD